MSDARQDHLSRIETLWTVVRHAHGPAAEAAQVALVERYSPAIRRYLGALLRDDAAAEEVFQEFALRLLRGDLRRVDPAKGRFRDYVKRTLINLANEHRARDARWRRHVPLDAAAADPAAPDDQAGTGHGQEDRAFEDAWRAELLGRAWEALEAAQRETGQPYHAVLRLRTECPDATSEELAGRLGQRLGAAVNAAHARKLLQRARERFAALLLAEVRRSADTDDLAAVEDELIDLDLQHYCRSALAAARRGGG